MFYERVKHEEEVKGKGVYNCKCLFPPQHVNVILIALIFTTSNSKFVNSFNSEINSSVSKMMSS